MDKIFNEKEIQGIISMGIYWEEISHRETDTNDIFHQELVQLYKFIGPLKILFAVLDVAKRLKGEK